MCAKFALKKSQIALPKFYLQRTITNHEKTKANRTLVPLLSHCPMLSSLKCWIRLVPHLLSAFATDSNLVVAFEHDCAKTARRTEADPASDRKRDIVAAIARASNFECDLLPDGIVVVFRPS